MRLSEILRGETCWTSGYYARDKDGETCYAHADTAVCWCISGAIHKAIGEPGDEFKARKDWLDNRRKWLSLASKAAEWILAGYEISEDAKDQYERLGVPEGVLVEFNDEGIAEWPDIQRLIAYLEGEEVPA